MEFFEDLKDKTIDLAQAGMAKSKQLMEIAKLSMSNSSEETAIRRAYTQLGKLYYAEHHEAPGAAYQSLCERITQSKINIEENKARIAELKQKDNIKNADINAVVTDVPPEEPECGCGCCDADTPAEPEPAPPTGEEDSN